MNFLVTCCNPIKIARSVLTYALAGLSGANFSPAVTLASLGSIEVPWVPFELLWGFSTSHKTLDTHTTCTTTPDLTLHLLLSLLPIRLFVSKKLGGFEPQFWHFALFSTCAECSVFSGLELQRCHEKWLRWARTHLWRPGVDAPIAGTYVAAFASVYLDLLTSLLHEILVSGLSIRCESGLALHVDGLPLSGQ